MNVFGYVYIVGWATTNDAIVNECYNEQFLSKRSRRYYEKRCYNERGGVLFIVESSIIVFTKERFFMFFMCFGLFTLFIRENLFIVRAKESLFMLFKFTCTEYKS
jgi:hypothetical protein